MDNTADKPVGDADADTACSPPPAADSTSGGWTDPQLEALLNDLALTYQSEFDLEQGLERLRASHGAMGFTAQPQGHARQQP